MFTLCADHYDWDVWAEGAELAVELIELLETGLILQTEDQDDCISPAAELQEEKDRWADVILLCTDGWWNV